MLALHHKQKTFWAGFGVLFGIALMPLLVYGIMHAMVELTPDI